MQFLLFPARHIALHHKADEADDTDNTRDNVEGAPPRFLGVFELGVDELAVDDVRDEKHQERDDCEPGFVENVLGVVGSCEAHGGEDVLVLEVVEREAHDEGRDDQEEAEGGCPDDYEWQVFVDKHLHVHFYVL